MKEFFMFSLGVPLSKSFLNSFLKILQERMTRVLKTIPAFEDLSCQTQEELIEKRVPLAIALLLVRGEKSSGKEQLTDGMGYLDEQIWEEAYHPVFQSPNKIIPVSLKSVLQMTGEEERQFLELVSDLEVLTLDPSTFNCSVLITLTELDRGKVPRHLLLECSRKKLANLTIHYGNFT